MDSLTLAFIILLLPLLTFVGLALTHKALPRHGDFIGTGAMATAFVCSLILFGRARFGDEPLFIHWTFDWLPLTANNNLQGGILIDGLTAVMLVVVTLVSLLVHVFSSKYMEGDVRYGRYYASLMLFTTSMLGLILADNLLFLFIFWELVGLSSYVLIGHWYEKKSASDAAIKAFITTRIGDVGMLIGLLILYWHVGSLSYVDLFSSVGQVAALNDTVVIPFFEFRTTWLTLAGLGLFFGAMGKSAQFPLHVWLPDAMEGPTPVSALIHAATMVAAGVYLVGRLFPLFTHDAFIFIAYIGAITAIFAASIAIVQDDIKKVLAYSTLSQLGYMMAALGVGGIIVNGYYAGLFHLTTHAFFKAGLFLGSGSVIHAMHHEQSLSKYGGLRKKLPITHATYLICVLAIIGCPFLSGFHSKDAIVATVLQFGVDQPHHLFITLSICITAFMTAFYMFRQYFLTFWGEPRDHHAYDHAHESPWQMALPLIILAALAIGAGGFFGRWFEKTAPPPGRDAIIANYAAYHQKAGTVAGAAVTLEAIKHLKPAADHAHGHDGHSADGHGDAHGEGHGDGRHNGVSTGVHLLAGLLSILLAAGGVTVAYFGYGIAKAKRRYDPAIVARRFKSLHTLLIHKYYFDEMYGMLVLFITGFLIHLMAAIDKYVVDRIVNMVGYAGKIASFVVGVFDNGVIDGIVTGSALGTGWAGDRLSYTQTGRVRNYLLYIALGVIGLSGILIVAF